MKIAPRNLLALISLLLPHSFSWSQSTLEITEFLTINETGLTDEDGDASDWIEIHNTSDSSINLSNWSLTDDIDSTDQWIFPDIDLAADERLVIFASKKERAETDGTELHTNFKLSGDGEYLGLYDPDGNVVSEFNPEYPEQLTDVSCGFGFPNNDTSLPEQVIFFQTPTPGEEEGIGALGVINDIQFDIKRGFFDSTFTETITCSTPGVTLVYTLDGSIPTLSNGTAVEPDSEDSEGYVELEISETTNLRVAAIKSGWLSSDIDTQTYLFLDDVIEQDGTDLQEHADWGEFGPDWDMDPEIVNDPTWGETMKSDLESIPSVSITMDWDDLFGDAPQGIYEEGESDPRNCCVEYLVADDSEEGFHINASIQIQGGGSTDRWRVDKLSMRLKFDEEFDKNDMEYQLYPDSSVDKFDTLILAAGHNLVWQHSNINQSGRAGILREQLVGNLQIQMSGQGATHHARFIHLYLNGLYWGLYALQERTDDAFAASYLGGDKDDYTVVKHDSETLVSGDLVHYESLLAQSRKDQTDENNYEDTKKILDIDALQNYMVLNHWAGSYDWAHQNWYASFNHDAINGKWRYHSWDMEHVLYALDHMVMDENDTTLVFNTKERDDTGSPVEVHYNMMENEDYRLAFADCIQKHLRNSGILTPDNLIEKFDALFDEINGAVNCEAARWGDTNEDSNGTEYTKDDWLSEMDWMRNTYLQERSEIVIQQYMSKSWLPEEGDVRFSPWGGEYDSSIDVEIETDDDYQIYLTTDGSDPRNENREVSSTAITFESAQTLNIASTTKLKARSLSENGDWGPLSETQYLIGTTVLPDSENLIISEIHYNPADPSADELSSGILDSNNDFEFIEFFNPQTDVIIDLSKIFFSDGILFDFPESSFLEPQQRIVLVNNIEAFELRYSSLNISQKVLGEYAGNLSNGGEDIALKKSSGEEFLRLEYSDSDPWPDSPDGDGFSLVYNIAASDQNEATNWTDSSIEGGTPGYEESSDAYTNWALANSLIGGPNDDDDEDQLSNLSEYFFGTNPNEFDKITDIIQTKIIEYSSNSYPALIYQNSLSADNLSGVLETSTDMLSWTEENDLSLIISTEDLGNGNQKLTLRSPNPVSTSSNAEYLRLKIQQN